MAALLGAHWVCFFASAQIGGVALCTLSVSTFPLFTIVIETAQKRRWPSIGSMVAGFTIILAVSLLMRSGPVPLLSAALSVVFGLAAAILFAVFALMSQTHVHSFGTLRLAFYQYGLAALLVSPLLLLSPPFKTSTDWLGIAVLGLVGTALAHQLYLYALARLPAAFCGAIVSLEPIFAIVLAALIFKEEATPVVWLSGAMIILASRVLMRSAA
jgi:drug/metabolite transporter (DMT)-like permease